MSKLAISALLCVKNEERDLPATLAVLAHTFSEIVVVDSSSTDGTVAIARRSGARVVQFEWNGSYPKKKQWSLENVEFANAWVFFFDGDERPSEELLRELSAVDWADHLSVDAYFVPITYGFAGHLLRFGYVVRKCALVRLGRVQFPVVPDLDIPGITEVEGHYQPHVQGRIDALRGAIVHEDTDGISAWFDRHNRYSDWEAHVKLDGSARDIVRRHKSRQGQIFDRIPFKALTFFVYSYVVRRGFLDGRAGFDYAIGLSMYRWQIGVKARELRRVRGSAHNSRRPRA